jgi:excisionase family DNA binding protein
MRDQAQYQSMQDAKSGQTPQDNKIHEDPPNEHFMPVKDAAVLLDMSEIHIRRAFDAGHFPGIKLGRLYRVSRPFVYALLAEVNAGRRIVVEEFAADWPAPVEAVA